jgi:hypothetical protein
MFREAPSSFLILALAAASVAALSGGCSKEGTYTLTLKLGTADGPSEDVTPFACGYHGIGAWLVTENGELGDTFPCGEGPLVRHTKPGNYSVIVRALDAAGARKTAPGDTVPDLSPYLHVVVPAPVVVEDGKTTTVPGPLFILPLPECEDGVDNDCDGRIDLLDPSCSKLPGTSCSAEVPCPDATRWTCQAAVSACITTGRELADDDRAGTGCVHEKKDGGPADGADASPVDAAGGQGGGQAGGQAGSGAGNGGGGMGGGAGNGGGGAGGVSAGGAGGAGTAGTSGAGGLGVGGGGGVGAPGGGGASGAGGAGGQGGQSGQGGGGGTASSGGSSG